MKLVVFVFFVVREMKRRNVNIMNVLIIVVIVELMFLRLSFLKIGMRVVKNVVRSV